MKYVNPTDSRAAQRAVPRALGLDPGDGPGLEEAVSEDVPATMLTLEAMSTLDYEVPNVDITSVGKAPTGRKKIPDSDFTSPDGLASGTRPRPRRR